MTRFDAAVIMLADLIGEEFSEESWLTIKMIVREELRAMTTRARHTLREQRELRLSSQEGK